MITNHWIAGVTTWDAIKNHDGDTDWIVDKQGNRTGDRSGHITDVINDSDEEARAVWIDAYSGSGDSGGPYYREIEDRDPPQFYITGIHAWGSGSDCPNAPSGGNTMEYIEDFWDITV